MGATLKWYNESGNMIRNRKIGELFETMVCLHTPIFGYCWEIIVSEYKAKIQPLFLW